MNAQMSSKANVSCLILLLLQCKVGYKDKITMLTLTNAH